MLRIIFEVRYKNNLRTWENMTTLSLAVAVVPAVSQRVPGEGTQEASHDGTACHRTCGRR